eukprot:2347493-Prymnesium_polylepis.1
MQVTHAVAGEPREGGDGSGVSPRMTGRCWAFVLGRRMQAAAFALCCGARRMASEEVAAHTTLVCT